MTRIPTGQEMIADANMERLSGNPMPGDGIAMGMTEDGELALQVVWLASEAPRLQDRVLVPSKKGVGDDVEGAMRVVFRDDPEGANVGAGSVVSPKEAINYPAMLAMGGFHAVSNGMQTMGVLRSAASHQPVGGAGEEMLKWPPYSQTGHLEDDRIARIGGVMRPMPDGRSWYSLAVSRMAENGGVELVAYEGNFEEDFRGGVERGIAVAAFEGNERFAPARLILPVGEDVAETLELYGRALASDGLSAVAVKGIETATGRETEISFANKPGPDVPPSSFANRFFV